VPCIFSLDLGQRGRELSEHFQPFSVTRQRGWPFLVGPVIKAQRRGSPIIEVQRVRQMDVGNTEMHSHQVKSPLRRIYDERVCLPFPRNPGAILQGCEATVREHLKCELHRLRTRKPAEM
jgi:hypothetical protein